MLDGPLAGLVVPASRLAIEPPRKRLSTGLPNLDARLGGGWPAAALSEITGRRSAGRTSVLYSALAAALGAGHAAALVDAPAALDPRAAQTAGVVLDRLLWVHAGTARTALHAAELLVAAGGWGLVALDLGERPAHAPTAAWQRLRNAAARQRTVVLVASPWRVAGTAASAAVIMKDHRPRFTRGPGAVPLLIGLDTRAVIDRGVNGSGDHDVSQSTPADGLHFAAHAK